MSHIPRIMNCSPVKILAVLDDSHVSHHSDTEMAINPPSYPVTQLAICQKKGETQYQLFFCNEDWTTLSTESFASLELATKYAEKEFPGVHALWMTPSAATQHKV